MTHEMKLTEQPFAAICEGRKRYELRLFDEKRRRITPGDEIIFTLAGTEKTVRRTVAALHIFPSFAALYSALPLTECGYSEEELPAADPLDMREYYSEEDELRFGVVAIELL